MLKNDKNSILMLTIYQNRYGECENGKGITYSVSAYDSCTNPFTYDIN